MELLFLHTMTRPIVLTDGLKETHTEERPHLLLHRLHLGVASCPSETRARPAARRGGVRFGPLMGPSGRGRKDLPLTWDGAVRGGAGRGGGVNIAAVVPPVAATVGRRGGGAVREGQRAVGVGRGFELVGQDEFAEFVSSGVALGGNVHVGRVRPQQPRRQQREGDAPSAAVHLNTTRTRDG